jgi:hypothetical protein
MMYSNHAHYLREWIEFHRLIGVEKFFLYDNGSSDDHLEVIEPYLEEGAVVLHDWPGVAQQHGAYDDCLQTHAADARWIAFIDVDEFLFNPRGKAVPDVLREFESWPGVGVNEAMFGTSGHVTRPEGLVIENYLWRTTDPSHVWIKSIVDPSRTLFAHGAHHFEYRSGHAVDTRKRPITGWCTESYVQARLRLNHYFTKSLEELQAKFARPRADTGELRPPLDLRKLRRIESRYSRDETILMYLPRLEAAVRARENRPPRRVDTA